MKTEYRIVGNYIGGTDVVGTVYSEDAIETRIKEYIKESKRYKVPNHKIATVFEVKTFYTITPAEFERIEG